MTRCGLKRGVFGLVGGLCGRTLAGEHDRRQNRASGDAGDADADGSGGLGALDGFGGTDVPAY